jgi:hypothetical protein
MPGPKSLSVKDVSAAAKRSAARVLEQQKLPKPPRFDVGFCPPPWWWIGIVIRDPGPWTLADAKEASVALHRGIAAAVPSVKGGKPGAVLLDGDLTIGFVPPKEINILQE